MNIPIQGRFLNIGHLSSNYPPITITSGSTLITAGSNVGVDSYSNTNQRLYFNSFSYTPQVSEITAELTGYTAGQPFTYIGVINSRYSGFNSNLVSYYSNMDRTAVNWKADCGAVVNNVTRITSSVATASPTFGLRVSPLNRFSWRIYERQPASGYPNNNYLNNTRTYSANTGVNEGYFPNEIVEGGPVMYTNIRVALWPDPQPNDPGLNFGNGNASYGFKFVLDVSDGNNDSSGFWVSSNYF